MKKRLFWLAAGLLSTAAENAAPDTAQTDTAAAQALSQPADPALVKNVKLSNLRLGFVNFRRIMSTAPQLESIRSELDREFKDQENALRRSQDELSALEKKAKAQQGSADYDTIAQQLIAKRREAARQDAQLRDNYSVRRNEEVAKLQTLVLDQIVGLAKEQGFDVILNDIGVIYVSENADLTDLVIARLNKLSLPQKTEEPAATPPQPETEKQP